MRAADEGGGLTHLTPAGEARMVDVSPKPATERAAAAEAFVRMSGEAVAALREGTVAKGDVLGVARVAGIMAAKRTSELIPLCHPLQVTSVEVGLEVTGEGVAVTAAVKTTDRTGVEMEALVAASVAALTVYDMCKAVDRAMTVERVRLLRKSGGRSGTWVRQA